MHVSLDPLAGLVACAVGVLVTLPSLPLSKRYIIKSIDRVVSPMIPLPTTVMHMNPNQLTPDKISEQTAYVVEVDAVQMYPNYPWMGKIEMTLAWNVTSCPQGPE
ncbi:unnamed protein product [Fusarium venenatum]|uniref:Uncharacterized protein n=1 Tax=Fusarium venenatum TaxID=56646 RepID=A0A2L2TN17_9HYPO|nr:uncharacterized protein FVRRES_09810 [Fusarium venenatum]CEI69733.1 unnamed protein product [Fusarium venenatum]